MLKENAVETIVGGLVVVVAAAFFIFAFKTAGIGTTVGGYQINAQFERVDGVRVGTDVRMSGIKVGSVVGQRLDTENFEAVMTLSISNEVRVPEDSTAKIASESLLGGNYVSLEPGGSEVMLKQGESLSHTQGSISILDLIGKFMFGGGSSKPAETPSAPAESETPDAPAKE